MAEEFTALKELLTIGDLKKIIAELPDDMMVFRPANEGMEMPIHICQVRTLCRENNGRVSDANSFTKAPTFKGLSIY